MNEDGHILTIHSVVAGVSQSEYIKPIPAAVIGSLIPDVSFLLQLLSMEGGGSSSVSISAFAAPPRSSVKK